MACFSLVEAGLAGPAQVGLLKPVEREQRPLDAAEFGQRKIQPVLALVGGQLAQDRGGRNGSFLNGPVGPKLRFWPSRRTFWERGIRY
jgi:hypothetical protein